MRNPLFRILLCPILETKMALNPIQIGRSIGLGLGLGLGAVWTLSAFYYEAINIGKKIGQLSVARRLKCEFDPLVKNSIGQELILLSSFQNSN